MCCFMISIVFIQYGGKPPYNDDARQSNGAFTISTNICEKALETRLSRHKKNDRVTEKLYQLLYQI